MFSVGMSLSIHIIPNLSYYQITILKYTKYKNQLNEIISERITHIIENNNLKDSIYKILSVDCIIGSINLYM